MKIAILTLPLGINYGGIMQAWALQKTLNAKGHDAITIRLAFEHKSVVNFGRRLTKMILIKIKRKAAPPALTEHNLQKICHNTNLFLETNLTLSPKISNIRELKRYIAENNFDLIFVGSDQVWRKWRGWSYKIFFIPFFSGRARKIAYAASFGNAFVQDTPLEKKALESCLKNFSSISVREYEGINILHEHFNCPASLAADPVLLIEPQEYQQLTIQSNGQTKNPYIFHYILDKAVWTDEACALLATQTGITFKSVQPMRSITEDGNDLTDYVFPPVQDWISGLRDSEIVITDSYHGLLFSIIFKKPVIILLNTSRGASRIKTIQKLLGDKYPFIVISESKNIELIIHEFVLSLSSFNTSDISTPKLDDLIKNSLKWIDDAVSRG